MSTTTEASNFSGQAWLQDVIRTAILAGRASVLEGCISGTSLDDAWIDGEVERLFQEMFGGSGGAAAILQCIWDQGRYDEALDAVVTCYRCGRTTQFLTQCKCGAP